MFRVSKAVFVVLSVGVALLTSAEGAMSATALPANWFVAGSHPENLTVDVRDETMHLTGTNDAFLSDFATAMQTISSLHYAGKSVRLTADVKSANVDGWVGLWMRVDGRSREVLAFDNMQTRKITGTTDWKTYSVVLPVDASASDIAFGVLLSGRGEAWMKNLSFRVADSDAPGTSVRALPAEPNLELRPRDAP